jgi:hypothetical protein
MGSQPCTELQVGAVNELIICARTDKVAQLLSLLEVEGVELSASGKQPPPLLVLARLEKLAQGRLLIETTATFLSNLCYIGP